MKWRQPLILLFVLGLLGSTLGLGLWGTFFYLLLAFRVVTLGIEFVVAVAPLWLLRRQVQRDVADPSGAIQAGMRWWYVSYVGLCTLICWLPWLRPPFIPDVPAHYVWVQYLIAGLLTLLVGIAVFCRKQGQYVRHQAGQTRGE